MAQRQGEAWEGDVGIEDEIHEGGVLFAPRHMIEHIPEGSIAVHGAAPPGASDALGGTEALGEEHVVAEVAGVPLVEEEVIPQAAFGALEIVEGPGGAPELEGQAQEIGDRAPFVTRSGGVSAAAEELEDAAVRRKIGRGHEVAVAGLDVAEQAGVGGRARGHDQTT